MTPQSFSLIFLIALFPTAFSIIPLDRLFPYGTTHGDTEMERGDDAEMANRARREVEGHETSRSISNAAEEEECKKEDVFVSIQPSDIVVLPTQISMTDEYGFNGNDTFHFYCAVRGKNVQMYFTRVHHEYDRYLGNATEEDMTRSEIEQIFDKEFVSSSKCILAKRLTIQFTNAESAGLYRCFAKKKLHTIFYDYDEKEIRLKLERSGGMCHNGSEFLCADGRQCISLSQACDGIRDCEDGGDEEDWPGCSMPDTVDMRPEVVRLDIPEGGSVNFSCGALRGKFFSAPHSHFTWRVNFTVINCQAPDCHQESKNWTSTLTLKNIKRENEGGYNCEGNFMGNPRKTNSKRWILHVVDKQPGDIDIDIITYGKEIPDKFFGYWKLDDNTNFDAYLNARYHSQLAREKAKNDMKRKTILRTGTGSYSWVSKEGIYDNVVLGKEFPCTSSFCVDQSKWVVFVYLPANETIVETHKMNSKSIYDYRYTVEDGKLVKHMEWGNVTAQLFYRNDDSK
ncbi:low-density lipoprotein receptor domain class A domain-containing protein [Ditylenchus destructor]|nr:low-density lipoprotein receptor domain class A domain-containing protein [Ditylenchus destructor]